MMSLTRRLSVAGIFSLLALCCFSVPLLAQEENGATPETENAETPPVAGEGYQLQDLDDPLEPLTPIKPRTGQTEKEIQAVSWYMTGQIHEKRRNWQSAWDAYQNALKVNDKEPEIYRSLVPLAFRLNKQKDAEQYARKAVELDPGDYELLRRLGVFMASTRRIPEAIQYLEQALKSPVLDKHSSAAVILNRDLSILYSATGQIQEAADCYEVLFDALTNPLKYKIDFRMRAELLKERTTNYERMGQAFMLAERYKLAVQAFEKAAEARPGNPGTLSYYLAQVYLQTKEYDKALKQLQGYFDAQLQSKGRDAYELLADILKSLGREKELIARLEKLAKDDPRNQTLQFFLAEQYIAADYLEKAASIYEQSLAGGGDPVGFRGLAVIYRRQKKVDDYLKTLAEAVPGSLDLKDISEELEAAVKDEEFVGDVIQQGIQQKKDGKIPLSLKQAYLLGRIAGDAKETDAAVQFLNEALSLAKGQQLGEIYNELGSTFLVARRYAEAVKIFENAVDEPALSNNQPNYLYRLCQARELNGDTQGALDAIRKAQQLIPNHPLLEYQEGWVYYHAHDWKPAQQIFEKVIASYPDNKDIMRRAQYSLSNLFVQQGDIRKGEEVLEQVYEEDPEDPSVNNDLGYLYADQGKKLEQAEKMIRLALDAEPDNGAYQDSMAWVLFKLGKHQEALKWALKAAKTEAGEDPTIQDHLGDIYHALGQTEKAVVSWEKALKAAEEESRPDEKMVNRIRQKLAAQKEGVGELKPESPDTP